MELERKISSLEQAVSEKDVRLRNKEMSPHVLVDKPQTHNSEEEIQEPVLENGLAAEMEQVLANFKLSWDTQSDHATGDCFQEN